MVYTEGLSNEEVAANPGVNIQKGLTKSEKLQLIDAFCNFITNFILFFI